MLRSNDTVKIVEVFAWGPLCSRKLAANPKLLAGTPGSPRCQGSPVQKLLKPPRGCNCRDQQGPDDGPSKLLVKKEGPIARLGWTGDQSAMDRGFWRENKGQ